jgi:hypothetical protein
MDDASHTILAMRSTEVRIISTAVKSVLVDRSAIGKNSRVAVGIIRRTKLSIGDARSATGDTMAATDPGPSHRVAHVDADFVWHKGKALSDRHIENLAGSRWNAVWHWLSILIENPNGFESALIFCGDSGASVSRISLR